MAQKNPQIRLIIATGIYPPDIGGPATYSKLLNDELPNRGISVCVVSFGVVRRWPPVIRHLFYTFLLAAKSLRSDVIYAQDPVSVGLPALIVATLFRKRFLLKVVGDYAWEQGTARFGVTDSLDVFSKVDGGYHVFVRLLKRVEKLVAMHAERIIVPSKYLGQIIANWGVPKDHITVIYNTFEIPKSIAKKEVLRELMNLHGRVLISIGRLVPWKGFRVLIEIMPDLIKRFPDLKLFIVGSGIDGAELERLIERLHLEEYVVLVGQLDHETLLRYLFASDVFILNTFYEGFSHQILEAMALSVPIVTTAVGGNAEVLENKKTALVATYNNKKELTKSVVALLNDPRLCETLTRNARTKVKQFGKNAMLKKLVDVL